MAPMDGKVQHILFTFGGQIRDRDNTVLTNDSKISTIVPDTTLDIEGSNGEGTGKAYYNRISRICYGASVHDLYIGQCAGGKTVAGVYAGRSQPLG